MKKIEVICEFCAEHYIVIQKEDSNAELQNCPFCNSVVTMTEDLEIEDE